MFFSSRIVNARNSLTTDTVCADSLDTVEMFAQKKSGRAAVRVLLMLFLYPIHLPVFGGPKTSHLYPAIFTLPNQK